MPKAPITYRESFIAIMRGGQRDYLGNFPKRELEWNAVETELGTMVEPRENWQDPSRIVQVDAIDNSVSKFTEISDEGVFQNQYGTGGGTLIDFNA